MIPGTPEWDEYSRRRAEAKILREYPDDKKVLTIIRCRFSQWEHPSGNWKNIDWLKYRLSIFKDLTLPCFMRQRDQDFRVALLVHPMTPACISQYFDDFEPYVDIVPDFDRYREQMYKLYRPDMIREVRNDSDDLICPEAMGIYTGVEGVEVAHFQDGYYYRMSAEELFEWNYPENSAPQFGVHLVPGKEWAFNYKDWFDIRGGGMHTAMRWWDHRLKLPGRMFMVLGNGSNASKQDRFCGAKIENPSGIFDQYGFTEDLRKQYQELSNAF
jgi:Putative rhamnosyl transferase